MIDIIYLLIFICFIAPISLLFHELGHVVGAILMKASFIRLTIGIGNKLWQGTFQHVQIIIRRFFLINSLTSTIREEPFERREKIMITLMGPVFSGLLAAIFYVMYHLFFSTYILYIVFLFNIWLMIINLLPFKIGQKQSDGYTIYKLIVKHK
ncbi:site-2 protease family protein [Pseudogracilibacillus auburnensis]|uniref:site-2 protease family protein n=1 Tax=Pseudogracilibacillus auburnensis TaxID=1494959 RepID=UPI001A962FCE|nr:site-2 protease family protein [Pseudogracilibacillus auburnensis]MBO1003092.1 hypothetical protein [Pseudogracilibacillus auburnensis]